MKKSLKDSSSLPILSQLIFLLPSITSKLETSMDGDNRTDQEADAERKAFQDLWEQFKKSS